MKKSRLLQPSRLADLAALLISLAAFFSTFWTARTIFENLPHLEDEMAYVWEAKAIAGGHAWVAAPACSRCYLMPFVIDYQGKRFGKYPLAWPVVLSLGIDLGGRDYVNPLLGAASAWLIYRLGKKLFNPVTGLMAAALTATSPFFVMNTSSLLSHTWGLFLTLVLVHAWLDTFFPQLRDTGVPPALSAACAAGALGLLALSRPLTAAAAGLPFAVHGLVVLWKGQPQDRRRAVWIALGAGLISSLHFLWQYALTGDMMMNPYTLWWSYDTIGFGPGIGLQDGGYSLMDAWVNLMFSYRVLSHDLFGWPFLSLVFIPFGLWAGRKSAPVWLMAALIPSIILGYALYWVTSWLYGPRYYFEALPALAVLSAAGISWCAGLLSRPQPAALDRPRFSRLARLTITLMVVALLVSANLIYYMPPRLAGFRGLYGVAREHILPFLTSEFKAQTPALIIVHKRISWYEYGTLTDLETPYLDTPYVFIYDPSPEEESSIVQQYPHRAVFHYYSDEPYHLYRSPRQ